jgi:F-type H+-transporting ATPase subunit alpha
VPVEDVSRFESELLDHLRGADNGILSDIRESQKLGEETEKKLTDAIKDFKKGFAATGGGSVVPDEHAEALDEDEVAKESVQVHKPAPPEQNKKKK